MMCDNPAATLDRDPPLPMTTIFLIRHGESTTNAGKRTSDPKAVGLSQKGKTQARALVQKLKALRISNVYCSAMPRTQLTAAPFLKDQKKTFTTLEIEEFSYLAPEETKNTTEGERAKLEDALWEHRDPNRCTPGGETFAALLKRVDAFLKILPTLPDRSACFGHGYFFATLIARTHFPRDSAVEMIGHVHRRIVSNNQQMGNTDIAEAHTKSSNVEPIRWPDVGPRVEVKHSPTYCQRL